MLQLMVLRQLCALKEHNCRENQYLKRPPLVSLTHTAKTEFTQNASFMTLYNLTLPQVRKLIRKSWNDQERVWSIWYGNHLCKYFGVTYFSISLFLQVRGMQEEEEEDERVLGSVLLLSPLLVEGISVDTKTEPKLVMLVGDFSNLLPFAHIAKFKRFCEKNTQNDLVA